MSVWIAIPSARPAIEVNAWAAEWRKMSYKIAVVRDNSDDVLEVDYQIAADQVWGRYPGYAQSVNRLAADVLAADSDCPWVVAAGDDTFPDPNKTGDEIAAELSAHFQEHWQRKLDDDPFDGPMAGRSDLVNFVRSGKGSTFAVVQCTGDRWADNLGVIIERIAGSPWLGRNWCERANAGKGPLWHEYEHMFVDQDLMDYAQHLGVFLQRPDLTHHHSHAQRDGRSKAAPHMARWNSQPHWQKSKAIYERMKATNFAGREPIA